jgi:hypothetical protein
MDGHLLRLTPSSCLSLPFMVHLPGEERKEGSRNHHFIGIVIVSICDVAQLSRTWLKSRGDHVCRNRRQTEGRSDVALNKVRGGRTLIWR